MRRVFGRNGSTFLRSARTAGLVFAALAATGCVATAPSNAGDPTDPAAGPFIESQDPQDLSWVTPLTATVVEADEPVDLVVATQRPDAVVVHFVVDGTEVGACDATAPDADCADDDLWTWTTTFDTDGPHTLTASVVTASGATVTTSQQITVVRNAPDDGTIDPGADPSEPDPLSDDQLVTEGSSQIVDAISSDVGYLDPSTQFHDACGGASWKTQGGRVLLQHRRIDGSVSRVDLCWQNYHDSFERYADLHYVSRASLVAAAIAAGNCADDARPWHHPLVRAAACAAIAHVDAATCAARMVSSPDFAIGVAAQYLARHGARRRHHNDPPREAAMLATGAVACSRRDAWHLRAPAHYIDHFVAAYNAYRTAERLGLPRPAGVTETADAVNVSNGAVTVRIDKHTGRADYVFHGTTVVSGAYSSVDLPGHGGWVTTNNYASHTVTHDALHDGSGAVVGVQVTVHHTSPSGGAIGATIDQVYSLYNDRTYFLLEEHVTSSTSTPIASNYLGALLVSRGGYVTPGPANDPRVLEVPFDNETRHPFEAHRLQGASPQGTSYEVSAVYDADSRRGLVIGSVTHDFWKTGIYFDGSNGRLHEMHVWGGVTTHDQNADHTSPDHRGTHDVDDHGSMTGTTLTSPRIFVGYYNDYRSGLEAFGRANADVAAARHWSGGPLFGWSSWGAVAKGYNPSTGENDPDVFTHAVETASDYIHDHLQHELDDRGATYINLDARPGGVDVASVVGHIHGNGQRAGTYMTPFSGFASYNPRNGESLPAPPSGVLQDHAGRPIYLATRNSDGSVNVRWALDPTDPATISRYEGAVQAAVDAGFDFIKLDFITDGSLEGHHADASVSTGVQAYNRAMADINGIIDRAGRPIFVSLSISPMFPSQYGNSRRTCVDVTDRFDTVAFLLNSLTYGWWMNGTIYSFNDPDEMSLYHWGPDHDHPDEHVDETVARAHVNAVAIGGTLFVDSTDYRDSAARSRADALLANPRVDALARRGVAFRPVEGDVGGGMSDAFVSRDGDNGAVYIAVFNNDPFHHTTRQIELGRAELESDRTYRVRRVWSGDNAGTARGTLTVDLAPGESELLELRP